MTEPRQVRWFNRIELLIVAIGIGLRIARFAQPRPLWLDEVMIALNVLTKSPHQLLFPLDYYQISPPGFLLGEWLVGQLGGTGEKALRLLPLIAGIAALILFARLARRILEPGTALLATALAALSPLLIYYSAEVKSYGFDWLAAVLVMHATLTVLEGVSRQAWVRWGLAATFGALVSTPAPFIVAGCALALLAAPAVRRGQRTLIYLVAAGTPAALISVLHLFMVYRLSDTTSFMQVVWTETFLQPGVLHAFRLAREFFGSVLFGVALSESLPRTIMTIIVAIAVVPLSLLGASCSSDDDGDSADTEESGDATADTEAADDAGDAEESGGNPEVEAFCDEVDEFVPAMEELIADPTSGDAGAMAEQAQELVAAGAALAGSVDSGDAERLQECTEKLAEVNG